MTIKVKLEETVIMKKLLWKFFNKLGLIEIEENQVKKECIQRIVKNLNIQKQKSNTQWLLIKGSGREQYWKGHLDTLDWMINWMENIIKAEI